jgi:hypothetical protein
MCRKVNHTPVKRCSSGGIGGGNGARSDDARGRGNGVSPVLLTIGS